jgi:hypothetical protein
MTYKVQIDDDVRNATPEEIANIEAIAADTAAKEAESKAKESAKDSALAKLAALGLTPEEISAIS